MKRLRLGVIGVGHLGRHHARILASLDGVELVGISDTRAEQARAIAEPLGTRVFDDPLALIRAVDAVSIAAPTIHHHALATAALDRGRHSLVEKPIAASVAQAEELVALAQRRGLVLQVGHIERFNPALDALRQRGWRPRFVDAERQGLFTFRSTDIGVVHDLMIHDLDVLLSLVPSTVTEVAAVGVALFGEHEDVANARLTFADGCVATLTASRASYNASRKMKVWSEEGYAALDFATRSALAIQPSERLRAGHLDLDGLDLTQPAAVKEHLFTNVLHVDQVPPPEPGREPLALELEDFVAAIRDARPPRVTGNDGLKALRVADRIVQSLRAHTWTDAAAVPPAGVRVSDPAGSPIPEPKLWRYRRDRAASRSEPNAGSGHAG